MGAHNIDVLQYTVLMLFSINAGSRDFMTSLPIPTPPLCLVLPQRCRKILVLPSGYWLTSIDIPKQNAACSKSSLDLLKKKWINKIHWSPNCFLYRRNVMNVTKNYWSIVTKQLYRRHGSHQSWIKEWFDAYRRQIASWTNTDY